MRPYVCRGGVHDSHGLDVKVQVDGEESLIQLDDTYPSIFDWHSATHFAMMLARESHPEAVNIEFIECGEEEMEEYKPYIHEAPYALQ